MPGTTTSTAGRRAQRPITSAVTVAVIETSASAIKRKNTVISQQQLNQLVESVVDKIVSADNPAIEIATLLQSFTSVFREVCESSAMSEGIAGGCQLIGETYRQLTDVQRLPPELAAAIMCRGPVATLSAVAAHARKAKANV